MVMPLFGRELQILFVVNKGKIGYSMVLYLSNSTEISIFNRLLKEKLIFPGNQMQKFNDSLIQGISEYQEIVVLSALQYVDVPAMRFDKITNGVSYIGIENHSGKLHKIWNAISLFREGCRLIRENRPSYILCDAIAVSPCYVAIALGKKYHIPKIGIVTDLPGMLRVNKDPMVGIGRMRKFDGYVLLTEQMNAIVNPTHKPHLVMEGLCAPRLPTVRTKNAHPRIILYTGSLWKHDAGIEYFVEGFIKADIPNCELHLYGIGELVDWLIEVEKTHPSVRYMGCVTNNEIVRKQCEATLLVNPRPSNEEFCKYSFPSKTIEYMASGTPVLMTCLPGVPDEYFDYVYTISEENSEGVCTTLKILLSDEDGIKEKGLKAREYVCTHKNCKKQAKRVVDFMNSVMLKKGLHIRQRGDEK